MLKKILIIISILIIIASLYLIEFSKIKNEGSSSNLTLDNLNYDELSSNWELFYKVRAKIIDGQRAEFTIPNELKEKEGSEMKLSGAAVFFGNGCKMLNDSTTEIKSFLLLPTLGLAQSCVITADEAMRWTIMIHLAKPWVINRNDMINAEVIVSGRFKTDTSKPYEAAFFIENASAVIK